MACLSMPAMTAERIEGMESLQQTNYRPAAGVHPRVT